MTGEDLDRVASRGVDSEVGDVSESEREDLRTARARELDKKGPSSDPKRELLVGCLSPHLKNPISTPAADGSLSQLVASLSLGLTRSESLTSDSILHNTLDPWYRGKGQRQGQNGVVHPGRGRGSDRGGGGGVGWDRDRDKEGDVSSLYSAGADGEDDTFIALADPQQDVDLALVYPILQPLSSSPITPITPTIHASSPSAKLTDNDPAPPLLVPASKVPKSSKGPFLLPWGRNQDLLKLSMYTDDPSSFLGSPWGVARVRVLDFLSAYRLAEYECKCA
jgi:hypothetical protein